MNNMRFTFSLTGALILKKRRCIGDHALSAIPSSRSLECAAVSCTHKINKRLLNNTEAYDKTSTALIRIYIKKRIRRKK